jgi:hypothetical protein
MRLVFWTAFNSYRSEKWLRGKPEGTPHPVTTPEWTAERVRLWQRYTLPSIQAQTVTDWLYIMLLDPELRNVTDPLLPKLDDPRIVYAYEDGPALDMLHNESEIIYALIDGDDMYSAQAGQIMLDCKSEWMYFKHGFALDQRSNTVCRYDTIGSGPFFAHRCDPKTMTVLDRAKRHPTHKAVIGLNPQELPGDNFCVLLHGLNTSSKPEMRYVLRHKPIKPRALRTLFPSLA